MDNKELYLSIKNDLDNYINDNYVFEEIVLNVAETKKRVVSKCVPPKGTPKPRLSKPKMYEGEALREVKPRSLDDLINHVNDTFQEAVFYHIDTKGLDEVEVYTNAHLDRRLFSKLRSNKDFKPSKKTAISICLGLKLNLDETKDLLEKAGYTLSHSSIADLIIEYFIKNKEYDLNVINSILYEYHQELLYV